MTEAEPPALGPQTTALLLSMVQDAYRQELAAEEDVHRSLPFFATALGLLIAAITYVAGRLPDWAAITDACPAMAQAILVRAAARCVWPELACSGLVVLASIQGALVLWFLALATRRQGYGRVPTEGALLDRAVALSRFDQARGLSDAERDAAALAELLPRMLVDYTNILDINRAVTLRRRRWRAAAMGVLLSSLLFVLAATTLVVMLSVFDVMPTGKR